MIEIARSIWTLLYGDVRSPDRKERIDAGVKRKREDQNSEEKVFYETSLPSSSMFEDS
jgi:hypothetical protein